MVYPDDTKPIADLTDKDLEDAGLTGEDVNEDVIEAVELARARPDLVTGLTLLSLRCMRRASTGSSPNTSIDSDPSSTSSRNNNPTSTAAVSPLVSAYERAAYYHGVSPQPPELLYRSDLETNPFPHPAPSERWPWTPIKTACGVFNTALNAVWHEVAPLIIQLLKDRQIRYTVVKAARFRIEIREGHKILGPIVIWIALRPGHNTAQDARDASPPINDILEKHGVTGAAVEWYEGIVEKLSGPPLLSPGAPFDATREMRRPLSTTLGMSIAARQAEDEDGQGSVAFFFHENLDKKGNPSDKVFAVTCKHVVHKDTTVDYEFKGHGAPRQDVRLCGIRRYERFRSDSRKLIATYSDKMVALARRIRGLEAKGDGPNDELDNLRSKLKFTRQEADAVQTLFNETDGHWHDIASRTIGNVHWSPASAIDVDTAYTRDLATLQIDGDRFRPHFMGNVVDLGTKYDHSTLNEMFRPNQASQSTVKFTDDLLLRIRGVVPRALVASPDTFDENGDPIFIVGKDGGRTDFTVGRCAGLEAYLWHDTGLESKEVAVYNYSREQTPNFSDHGDSGALIFTGEGQMLAILHSGVRKGGYTHVTFGTPAWWVIEQLKKRYPHAVFDREKF